MLEVSSLGKFQIVQGEKVLNDDVLRSDMLKKLLGYILTHREHPITVQELAEALWQEDETENPTGALKNLMYRLRNILKQAFGDNKYILTSPGAYSWNSEIAVSIDAEKFEECCKKAAAAKSDEDMRQSYEEAISLYKGEFLDHILDRHWAVTMSTYYHSMFITAIKQLAILYLRMERYQELERICIHGLQFDPVEEKFHYYRILSLIRQNKYHLAMENYEEANKILYNALGVKNTKSMQEIQKELLKMNKGTITERLENIQEDMVENETPLGAYICGYPVFREIYRLEVRKNSRLGEAEYMVLLTATLANGVHMENEKMERFVINQAMTQLEEAIKNSLRVADIASRYSDNQFIVLLPACTYENSILVSKRILTRFYELNKGKKIEIKTDFEQVSAEQSTFVK